MLNLDKPQVWDPDRYFKGLTLGARYTRTSIWSTGGKKFSPISRILPTPPSFFHRLAPWSRLTQSVSRRIHQKEENCDRDVTGKHFCKVGKFDFGMALKVERWAVPLDVLIKSLSHLISHLEHSDLGLVCVLQITGADGHRVTSRILWRENCLRFWSTAPKRPLLGPDASLSFQFFERQFPQVSFQKCYSLNSHTYRTSSYNNWLL